MAEHTAPRRMGFVHKHNIPWTSGADHGRDALGPRHEVTRDDDDAVLLPGMLGASYSSSDVLQGLPVEEPGGEGELFPQLLHPLPDQTARRDDQRPLHLALAR